MAKRKSNLERYCKCAEICSKTVYSDSAKIEANNRGVVKMYEIVDEAIRQGESAINELAVLLDDPLSAHWLAHQLLEKATLKPETEQKCLSIIWKLATQGNSCPAQQMGERIWLRKYNAKHSDD